MTLPFLASVVLAVLIAAYAIYGRVLARVFGLDDRTVTPAVARNDGVDFAPTGRFYLLSQHFSAIAAAGPVVGPILACQQFGWLPCILWITLGVVFIGAVHDISALVASVRHDALSVAGIVHTHLGERAWLAILAFIWIALVYVIVAFTDVTASTFIGHVEELEGIRVDFDQGGAVAMASALYLGLAIVMGMVQRWLRPPLWLLTVIFVPATLGAVWLGTQLSGVFALDVAEPHRVWSVIILAYCLIASMTPVWMLLQPRGYLGGFLLYLVLAVGTIGVFTSGASIEQPAFRGFVSPVATAPTNLLFPFLFVTIACGACSGFHGLVCSGTTSKQVARESDCREVGYGAMLLEGFVALIALSTVAIVARPEGAPGAIYGQGIGRFLTSIIGKEHALAATVFGSMAFSTFVFDTLDVTTRLGRYILQELFGRRTLGTAILATLATVGAPLAFVLTAESGSKAYMTYWVLFGTSNQLLAALTLLVISVWLKRSGRPYLFTLLPMLFLMVMTMTALVMQSAVLFKALAGTAEVTTPALANAVVALLLLALAAYLATGAFRTLRAVPATSTARSRPTEWSR